jgi:hypothetical protein
MTGRNFDTDPSTPGAMRSTADTDPIGASAEAGKPNTDPGLGPAGPPQAPPLPGAAGHGQGQGQGQVRPAVRVPGVGKQDSVEMLLDGMSAPQPERLKMTPQSAGEAAASYHAEHPVHPARTSPDEEPKVIVERPPLAPTVRVQREKLQAMIEQADALRRAREAEEADAREPVPVSMGPRVLIAAVAGLVVVLGIFVVARVMLRAGSGTTAATTATAPVPATATATSTATAGGAATATAAIPVADTTTDQPVAPPPPTAHVPISALPTAPAATAKPKPRPVSSSTSGSDVGEFKTTFH